MQELSRKAVLEQQEKNKLQMENVLEDQRKKFQEFLQEQVLREKIFYKMDKLHYLLYFYP